MASCHRDCSPAPNAHPRSILRSAMTIPPLNVCPISPMPSVAAPRELSTRDAWKPSARTLWPSWTRAAKSSFLIFRVSTISRQRESVFLVALKKRMRARNGDLIIYGLRPKQQRFLDILGFRGFFSVALDLRYAIEYILETKRDIFPISALCPACSSHFGIDGPGRRRCRACKAVLTVMADGTMELG